MTTVMMKMVTMDIATAVTYGVLVMCQALCLFTSGGSL